MFCRERTITVISLIFLVPPCICAQVVPTFEWVNFYGNSSTLGTMPLPVGSRVEARDPDSVLCGEFEVAISGKYGFLAVYRDDPFTQDVDEGATTGDTIRFFINGNPAIPLGPESPVWSANGDSRQVELTTDLPTSIIDASHGTSGPRSFQLSVYPNPSRGRMRFVADEIFGKAVNFQIYDVKGRRVREIRDRIDLSGFVATAWDGRDDTGRLVASGIYFLFVMGKSSMGSVRQSRKLVIIR